MKQLVGSVLANHGEEFDEAKSYDARSVVSRKTMKFLIRPGDVLVQYSEISATGFMAASWATESAATTSDSSKMALIWTPTSQVRMMHNNLVKAKLN